VRYYLSVLMLFRKSFTEFSFVSFKNFIFTLMRRHGFQSIVFSPEPENVDLFSANQLTHAAPNEDIEDPGGFIHAWRQNQTQVRRVSFTYSPIGGAFGIEMTIDLDEGIISLVRVTNRMISDQVKVVLEETFSGLQDVVETRGTEGSESEDIGSIPPTPWYKKEIARHIFTPIGVGLVVTVVGGVLVFWLTSVFWPTSPEPESKSIPSELQRETLLNSVYPEIELVGWDFEPRIETNPDTAQLTIKSIVNIGTGPARVIFFENIKLEGELPEECKRENAFTAHLPTKRVLLLPSGEKQELGTFSGLLSWKCANSAFLKEPFKERVLNFTFSVTYRDTYENKYEKVWRVRATEKSGNESRLESVAEMMDSPLDTNRHLYLTHAPLIKRNGIELGDLVVQGR